METFTGEFPSQKPVTRSFDFSFDRCLCNQLSKQPRRRWFETPSHSLCSALTVMPSHRSEVSGRVAYSMILRSRRVCRALHPPPLKEFWHLGGTWAVHWFVYQAFGRPFFIVRYVLLGELYPKAMIPWTLYFAFRFPSRQLIEPNRTFWRPRLPPLLSCYRGALEGSYPGTCPHSRSTAPMDTLGSINNWFLRWNHLNWSRGYGLW